MNNAQPRTYKKYSHDIRKSIVEAYNGNEDWRALCRALNVAYSWIRSGLVVPLTRGGRKYAKKTPEMVLRLVEAIEENPHITLKEAKALISSEFQIDVCVSTIKRWLDGELISLKKTRKCPISMNSDENKGLRKKYLENLLQDKAQNRTIVWIDESNVNLFCQRNEGRSKIGSRCTVIDANGRGPNVHMIGAITSTSLVSISIKRGSFTKEKCHEWLREIINICYQRQIVNLTIVCDNATCHRDIEKVIREGEDVKILRLAPYSFLLNPIELVWSQIKSKIKSKQLKRINIFQ